MKIAEIISDSEAAVDIQYWKKTIRHIRQQVKYFDEYANHAEYAQASANLFESCQNSDTLMLMLAENNPTTKNLVAQFMEVRAVALAKIKSGV